MQEAEKFSLKNETKIRKSFFYMKRKYKNTIFYRIKILEFIFK
jgi:hypothetical protein